MPQVLACGSREVLFVTAFEETGRSAFARYKRSNDNYRASFRALAEALNAYITTKIHLWLTMTSCGWGCRRTRWWRAAGGQRPLYLQNSCVGSGNCLCSRTDNIKKVEGLQNPLRPPAPLAMHIQAHNVTTSLSDSARGPRSAYGLH